MAIFRGIGGAGDSTTDATVTAVTEQATNAANSATNAATSASSASSSASAASTSASNASSSASAASTSAANAATSVSNASSSASSASTSATNAAASEAAAGASETAAAASESAAATSASNAASSASNAASSASSASSSASTATTQATNAASSASAAATSATNAANSATTASGYVSDAADQVTLATTQATNAANSATSASTSASSAASSAAAAASSLDSFDDRYLGAKSSAPTLDNDGNALITGALYYDTTEGLMFVYDGGQWIAASSASQAILTVYKYTATSGQTTFSGVDDNAATLGYTTGSIIVTLNGVFLESGDDYTATNGSSVVLSAGATTSDEVNIYSFNTFDVANVQVIGDERYVRLSTDQTVAGTKTLSSNPVLSAGTANGVTYLNGSKVLTTGSGLTFDGTNFVVNNGYIRANNTLGYYTTLTATGLTNFSTSMDFDSVSDYIFKRNSSEQMRLTSTGLGIGTTSPSSKLSVSGAVRRYYVTGGNPQAEEGFTYSDVTTAYAGMWFNNYFSSTLKTDILFKTSNDAGTVATVATLNGAGNLGLGVTPSAWVAGYKVLQVGNASWYTDGNANTYLAANTYQASGFVDTYISSNEAAKYEQINGAHKWFTAPSGTAGNAISFTQAMTLDASGNLGIGTSSPSTLLDVRGEVSVAYNATYGLRFYNQDRNNWSSIGCTVATGNASANLVFKDSTGIVATMTGGNVGIGTSSPNARLEALSSTAGAEISRFEGNYPASGTVNLTNWRRSGGAVASVMRYNDANTDMEFGTTTSHPQAFITGGTERMRIDSSGNLLVGYTSGNSKLTVNGAGWLSGGVYPSSAGADNSRIFDSTSGTTGTVTLYIGNAAITTSSDVRLKENIVNTQRNATEIIQQLRVVDHTWNDPSDTSINNRNSRGVWMGLIAQEAQPIIPWLVNKPLADEDEKGNPQYWHMDYGYAVPLLVKAIQEQQAIIESLTARVSALEGN
jgi:hypothetical protein